VKEFLAFVLATHWVSTSLFESITGVAAEKNECIIPQCLNKMPAGPTRVGDYKISPSPRGAMKENMDALAHHFLHFAKGYTVLSLFISFGGEIFNAHARYRE
jgi:hypothetical protein